MFTYSKYRHISQSDGKMQYNVLSVLFKFIYACTISNHYRRVVGQEAVSLFIFLSSSSGVIVSLRSDLILEIL